MAQRTPVGAGPRCRSWRILIGLSLAILSMASHGGTPAPQPLSVSDFQRTTFSEKEGALPRLWAISQTDDGWLWFGGSAGLARFDGVEFERIDVSTPDGRFSGLVSTLYALPSGGLAIGHAGGGVTILERGVFRRFGSEAVRASGRPTYFVADRQGVLWATFEHGLMRFDGGDWSVLGAGWDAPTDPKPELYLDISGTLWVHAHGRVVRLTRGARRFETVWQVSEPGYLLHAPDGAFWYEDAQGKALRLSEPDAAARPDPSLASRRSDTSYFDRRGALWGWRANAPDRPAFAVRGLEPIGDVSNIIEDTNGDIWLGDLRGNIHRLRRPAVSVLADPPAPYQPATLPLASFAFDKDGQPWVGMMARSDVAATRAAVWTIEDERLRLVAQGEGTATGVTNDRSGHVWWVLDRALWEWDGQRKTRHGELAKSIDVAQLGGLAAGCAGGTWAAVRGVGLLRFSAADGPGGTGIAGLPAVAPTSLACDDDGRLWLGYGDGRVARVEVQGDGAAGLNTTFIEFDGPRIGTVSAISAGAHTLVGGESGLAILQGTKFVRVSTQLPLLQDVTGVVETPEGSLWVNGARGLLRLEAKDLEAAAQRADIVPATLLDASDGVPGPAYSVARWSSTLARDARGRIWFSSGSHVGYVDPARLKPAPAATLALKAITADSRKFDTFEAPSLPVGTRNLEIAYTALGATHPERLRFRYRLDGIDTDWVDVGGRRLAYYTNLPPGTHRFQVDVTDARGVWTDKPATLAFEIPPTFVQSLPFKILCVAAALALLFIAYRWRMHQLERRHQQLLVERLDERGRIARELHDTLLQGTQALILKVHAVTQRPGLDAPARQALDKAMDQATEVVDEARNRIQDLRGEPGLQQDLVTSLSEFGEELLKGSAIAFKATVEGHSRELAPEVLREAFFIGREALLNAFHHAQARVIELQVVFADDRLRLRIRDDGRGFDEQALAASRDAGHWGVQGMRERARALSAMLDVWSRPGAGTEIELQVPGPAAYARRPHRRGL
jgi:signal transduction histidine kinase/ligand-binding sensor domain-containing protein